MSIYGEAFDAIFESFSSHSLQLKVLHVATCDPQGKPNSAPKMLVDVVLPNRVYFLDYVYTQTYANIVANGQASVSFMDDAAFRGFRLTGNCQVLETGKELEQARQRWAKRLIRYEATRIIDRARGLFSEKEAENALPHDFIIIRLDAQEGSIVKPDRVLRAITRSGKTDEK